MGNAMQKIHDLATTKWAKILFGSGIVLAASLIFALRYLPAFQIPNFYAEDGKIFINNALHKNPLGAMLSGFNGYLITGLYILVEVSVVVYKILGLHFYQLPIVVAVLSCLFLGLTAALPYLFLRKWLGTGLSLLAVLFGALVAVPSFDYAIIGTIGNLKFLFLYWAFILCIYCNLNAQDRRKTLVADLLMLLSITTYAPAMALLPFMLWPYRDLIGKAWKKRSVRLLYKPVVLSLVVVCFISFIYLIVIYVKGVPKIPGYLDTPYNIHATAKLAYRVTWYQWLFPISPTMRDLVTLGLLGITAFAGLRNMRNRFVFILASWSILISTVSFVVNRPGISSYFLAYGPNPDQFFYAQTLIFMVLCLWLAKPYYDRLTKINHALVLFAVFLFIWWAFPAYGSYGKNRVIYERLGTAKQNVQKVCSQRQQVVDLQSYPTEEWKWPIDKEIACK
jgi:hypothetical protein